MLRKSGTKRRIYILGIVRNMTAITVAVFEAPSEFEAALEPNGNVELLVTERGQFEAQLRRTLLRRLCVLSGDEWLARIAVVAIPVHSVLITLPIESLTSQVWAGAVMGPDEIITMSPGARVHVRTEGPCHWGAICISAAELARYGRVVVGHEFACPPGLRHWRSSRHNIQSLMGLFNAAVRLTDDQPSVTINTRAADGLEKRLIHALVNCLRSASLKTNQTTRNRHVAIMMQLEDILRTYSNRKPSVLEVCKVLGISQRGLLEVCKEQVGIGPGRYFRLGKMRRIHRALRGGRPGALGVAEVAKHYGINDPGRFAGVYRELFGELPSTTLRRTTESER
jgi:AraC-like DNA-binding protein